MTRAGALLGTAGGWSLRAGRRVLRRRGGAASAGIAALLLATALYVLPVHLLARPVQPWRMPAGMAALPAGTALPVFCMPPDGVAIHCGLATARADGTLGFAPYGRRPGGGTIPVLTEADLGLLWALAEPAGKARVRASAAGLERQIAGAVRDLTSSPTWQREYRPNVRRLLTRIAEQAWARPSTEAALQALIRAIEPLVAGKVAGEIGPAVAPYVADAIWPLLASNSTRVFALIAGEQPDLSPLSTAFSNALHDPAVQRVIGRLGPEVMALPQMELLSERLLGNLAEIAEHDPEAFDLATRIATDRRLGQPLGHVRDDLGAFLRQAGQVMWGLGDRRALNALAGVALKSTLMGTSEPLVLLIDPDSAVALERTLPGGVVLLVPEAAS
jgi:hypothetical protein